MKDLLRSPIPALATAAAVCLSVGAWSGPTHAGEGGTGARAPVEFASEVLPILSRNCFACHGPDSSTRTAGLRLDTRDGALSERGRRGPAIVPGDPGASLLLHRVTSDDPEERMPPEVPEGLSAAELELLERWIAEGASYAPHWSLLPISDPTPPGVAQPEWNVHPVDRFIRARLDAAGLEPAGTADRQALARRLAFDLTGLPLEATEARAFASDASPGSYERLVDRLLASPHYGERWARHWLDLVRYAETHGHEFDYPIAYAHGYRDYLIRAFNEDVPYGQLVTEHIAGDLLEQPRLHPDDGTNESVLGTGFWFLSPGTHAPTDVRQDEADRIDNQIDVLGKTFLATTIACARCHDHKFDPVGTDEYYALSGYLQSSRRQLAYLDPNGEIGRTTERLRGRRAEELAAWMPDPARTPSSDELASWLISASDVWLNTQPEPASEQADGAEDGDAKPEPVPPPTVDEVLAKLEGSFYEKAVLKYWVRALDRVTRGGGAHPMRAFADLALDPERAAIETAWWRERDELASDDDTLRPAVPISSRLDGWFATGSAFESTTLPAGARVRDSDGISYAPGPTIHSGTASDAPVGTLRSPTFLITAERIRYRVRGRNTQVRLVIDGYYLDGNNALLFEGMRFGVNTSGNWISHVQDVSAYVGHRAYVELVDDSRDGYLAVTEIALQESEDAPRAASAATREALEGEPLEDLSSLARLYAQWLAGERAPDGPAAREVAAWALSAGLLPVAEPDRLAQARAQRHQLEDSLPRPRRALALAEGTGEDEYVFVRGQHKNVGPVTPRRFLAAYSDGVPAHVTSGSGRLELARDILSPGNPLTDRVIVNRVWHHLFGRGIVPTVDDFGLLGEQPTHPELLDYLALWFRHEAHGSIKELVRWLVQTRTYRLASTGVDENANRIDPTNALLSRARLRRLQSEAIRDAILTASGTLDRELYGPPVPIHLTSFMNGRGRPGSSGPLDGAGRRSIYIEVRRNFLAPMMQVFDTPVPMTTIGRRNVSNVPAQALVLLNDPFVHAEATRWAERELGRSSTPDQRLERLYWGALGRAPSDDEKLACTELLRSLTSESPGTEWESDTAAWTDLCHALFNLKEFLYLR